MAGHDGFVARIPCISGFSGGRLSESSKCDFTKRKTKLLFLKSASESSAKGSYSNVKAHLVRAQIFPLNIILQPWSVSGA